MPTDPEMVPLQGERSGVCAHCAKKVRNGPVNADQCSVLQPAKAPAMCTDYASPPPHPTFLAGTNLSSKWITPTDNMRPKSDDIKKRHQWFS